MQDQSLQPAPIRRPVRQHQFVHLASLMANIGSLWTLPRRGHDIKQERLELVPRIRKCGAMASVRKAVQRWNHSVIDAWDELSWSNAAVRVVLRLGLKAPCFDASDAESKAAEILTFTSAPGLP